MHVSPDSITCSICLSMFTEPVRLSCGHCVCQVCFEELRVYAKPKLPKCPLCRASISGDAVPAVSENAFVRKSARTRSCGQHVADDDLRDHEHKCQVCRDEWVLAVHAQLRRISMCIVKSSVETTAKTRQCDRLAVRCAELENEVQHLKRKISHTKKREYRVMRRLCK